MQKAVPDVVSDQCSALVFYGIGTGTRRLEKYYHTMVDWFAEIGLRPSKLSVHGPGHGKKLVAFTRADAKLRKDGFTGVSYFELTASAPDAQSGHDFLLTAACMSSGKKAYADVVARSSLAALTSTSLLPIARIMVEELAPEYGIGYTLSHKLGPEFYAIGINFGVVGVPTGDAYEETRNISRWGDIGRVKHGFWGDGVLRDVYHWNFISASQRERLIRKRSA